MWALVHVLRRSVRAADTPAGRDRGQTPINGSLTPISPVVGQCCFSEDSGQVAAASSREPAEGGGRVGLAPRFVERGEAGVGAADVDVHVGGAGSNQTECPPIQ